MKKLSFKNCAERIDLHDCLVILSSIFFLGAGIVKSWASVFFFVLVLFSLFTFKMNFNIDLYKVEKILIAGFAAFYLPLFISFLNAGDIAHGIHRVERVEYYLLSVIPYFYLRRCRYRLIRPFCLGTIAAGPVMFAVAWWDVYVSGLDRASGYYNPIFLGQIGVLTASIALVSVVSGVFARRMNLLLTLSLLCALGAAILSGSRGPLFALPVIVVLCLMSAFRNYSCKKILVSSALILVASSLTLSLLNTTLILDRFNETFGESLQADIRYKIWQDALAMWDGHEIIGTGFGDYEFEHKAMIAGNTAKSPLLFAHAHSIYVEFLATTGLLGLFFLLTSLIAIPLYIFSRSLFDQLPDVRLAALAGLTAVVCFAVFGMTSAWTARSAANAIYAVCLLVTLTSLFNLRSLSPAPAQKDL